MYFTNDLYKNCRLCPRECGADRIAGPGGYCGESAELKLAFAGLHMGEEPPLSGKNGSGTIFVSGCNLGCAFCQNWQISGRHSSGQNCDNRSSEHLGRIVDADEFAAICLKLQKSGAENINIVTGSHSVPAIAGGLNAAKISGLQIPVLWNSSGYENLKTLELLDGMVDTWLPDLKTMDSTLAENFFNAPDYPKAAAGAIQWMLQNKPGQVIIRHLILPDHLESTAAVLRWFAENAAGKAQLSLMSQYTPIPGQSAGPEHFISEKEYDTVLAWLTEYGIDDGFCQELVTGDDWLPDFRCSNPFSSKLSVPVWHFLD